MKEIERDRISNAAQAVRAVKAKQQAEVEAEARRLAEVETES
jgi:hypothetical protein